MGKEILSFCKNPRPKTSQIEFGSVLAHVGEGLALSLPHGSVPVIRPIVRNSFELSRFRNAAIGFPRISLFQSKKSCWIKEHLWRLLSTVIARA